MRIKLIFLFLIFSLNYSDEIEIVWRQTGANETLIVKAGDAVTLKSPYSTSSVSWHLNGENNSMSTIYEDQKIHSEYRDRIECVPSEDTCESLILKSLDRVLVGEYARVSEPQMDTYNYLVTGYLAPISIASDLGNYDKNKNELFVRVDKGQATTCTVMLWQHIAYNISTRIEMSKCGSVISSTQLGVSCLNTFSRNDENLSCSFKSANTEIDRLDVKLNISFGPVRIDSEPGVLNALKGTQVRLVCPLIGNPIKYSWYLDPYTSLNESNREIRLPKTLKVGNYEPTCQADVISPAAHLTSFTITNYTTFRVHIQKVEKNKFPSVIVIAIGCLVVAVLVVLVPFVIIKYRNIGKTEPSVRYQRDLNRY